MQPITPPSLIAAVPASTAGLEQAGALPGAPLVPPASDAATDPQAALQSLALAIVRDAAARQGGLAQLFANLDAALARPGIDLPSQVRTAADQLLALRLAPAGDTGLDASTIKTALAQAGLGRAAQAALPASAANSAPVDLKAALVALRQALTGWIDSEPQTSAATNAAANAAATPPGAQAATALSADSRSTARTAAPMPSSGDEPTTLTTVRAAPRDGSLPRIAIRLLTVTAPRSWPGAGAVVARNPSPDPSPSSKMSAPAPDAAASSQSPATEGDVVDARARLAPLTADLEIAIAQPDVPEAVRSAAAQVLALASAPGRAATPDSADATAPPAQPAAGLATDIGTSTTGGDPTPTIPGSNLDIAILALRAAVSNWIASAGPAQPDTTPAASSSGQSDPEIQTSASVPASEPAAPPINPQTGASAPLPRAQTPPPPPYRGAPTTAQAPAGATLPDEVAPREVAAHLLTATDAALARHALLEIASLPDTPTGAGHDGSSPTRATFDVPLVTPQGTAVAQIRIERDEARRHSTPTEATWRVSFAIDFEPIGPVHASIMVTGQRAAVTLHAERPSSAERLREGLADLAASLQEADFDPGAIHCRTGTPPRPAAAPGLFVDRAS